MVSAADDFARDGYLVIPDAFAPAMLDIVRQRIVEMVDAFEPASVSTVFSTTDHQHGRDDYFLTSGDKTRFFYEEGVLDDVGNLLVDKHIALNKIGHAMHDQDPVFDAFCRSQPFADAAEIAGFDEAVLLQSMVIFKNPRVGGEVTAHTDHTFLWTEPQSAIGFWVAFDDATVDNGCLWALQGGHRLPVKSKFLRTADDTGTTMEILDDAPFPESGWVPLEAKAGTMVLLHGTLPHRSEPNTSDHSRLAFTLHCIERGAQYPTSNWLRRGDDLPLRNFSGV